MVLNEDNKMVVPIFVMILVIIGSGFCVSPIQTSERRNRPTTICVFSNYSESFIHPENPSSDIVWFDSKGQAFVSGCHYCFTLWDDNSILAQGCWIDSNQCNNEYCVSETYENALNETQPEKFCCCQGDGCNSNVSTHKLHWNAGSINSNSVPLEYLNDEEERHFYSFLLVAIISISTCICFLLIALGLFLYRKYNRKGDKYFHLVPSNNTGNNSIIRQQQHIVEIESSTKLLADTKDDLSNLSVHGNSFDYHGHFGAMYSGTLNGESVTVKVSSKRQLFINERQIYMLLRPNHPSSVSTYFGSRENIFYNGLHFESLLVTSWADRRSLYSLLKNFTPDWDQLCNMLTSITCGVSFLHSNTDLQSVNKPIICHRNLSSRSIYVHRDYTCYIADFDLAVNVSDNNSSTNNFIQLTEPLVNSNMFRYMAPECLEGAINLRDAESSLKQADVYSLGLVFWEISQRCVALYQGSKVPKFEIAYEREIGLNPTFEQMTVLVSRKKARPLFPDVWKDSNPAIQQLKETINESWDYDGEARLTAFTIQERTSELNGLWKRYHNRTVYNNDNSINSVANFSQIVRNITPVFHTNEFSTYNNQSLSGKEDKVGNIMSKQQPAVKIQPYQGRNPCIERNLNSDAFEITLPLLEKSVKERSSSKIPTPSTESLIIRHQLPIGRISAPPIPHLHNDCSFTVSSRSYNFHDQLVKKNNKSGRKWLFSPSKRSPNVVIKKSNDVVNPHEQQEAKSNLQLEKQRQTTHSERN